jgi:hypothetical protein
VPPRYQAAEVARVAQRRPLARAESPVIARSVQGENMAAAAGRDSPESRREGDQQSERKSSAGGFAADRDGGRGRNGAHAPIRSQRIIDRRWEGVLRRQVVSGRKHAEALGGEAGGNRPMRLGRARAVAAAVQIYQRKLRRARVFRSLACNAAQRAQLELDAFWSGCAGRREQAPSFGEIASVPEAWLEQVTHDPRCEISLPACHASTTGS